MTQCSHLHHTVSVTRGPWDLALCWHSICCYLWILITGNISLVIITFFLGMKVPHCWSIFCVNVKCHDLEVSQSVISESYLIFQIFCYKKFVFHWFLLKYCSIVTLSSKSNWSGWKDASTRTITNFHSWRWQFVTLVKFQMRKIAMTLVILKRGQGQICVGQ